MAGTRGTRGSRVRRHASYPNSLLRLAIPFTPYPQRSDPAVRGQKLRGKVKKDLRPFGLNASAAKASWGRRSQLSSYQWLEAPQRAASGLARALRWGEEDRSGPRRLGLSPYSPPRTMEGRPCW